VLERASYQIVLPLLHLLLKKMIRMPLNDDHCGHNSGISGNVDVNDDDAGGNDDYNDDDCNDEDDCDGDGEPSADPYISI
jgi:hypothetical protein